MSSFKKPQMREYTPVVPPKPTAKPTTNLSLWTYFRENLRDGWNPWPDFRTNVQGLQKVIDFYFPKHEVAGNILAARWLYSILGAAAVMCFMAILVSSFIHPGNGSGSSTSCESAYQEVLQRQTAGRLTEGAVNRLANCRH